MFQNKKIRGILLLKNFIEPKDLYSMESNIIISNVKGVDNMYELEDIIDQLSKMDLSFEQLNNIQLFLINNNYLSIRNLVFEKECLDVKDFIFYEENTTKLIESIEKGNGKIHFPFCQYAVNGGLYYYSFEKMKDIILIYQLYEVLDDTRSEEIVEFLIENYNIKEVDLK